MSAFDNLILDWWDTNRKVVSDELEDRTGQRPTEGNQLGVRRRQFTEGVENIQYGVVMFEGEIVAFLTVDWGEPSVKLTWV